MKISVLIYALLHMATILSISSCQSSHKIPSLRKEHKKIYMDEFKLTYFKKLLIKSYNNSKTVSEIFSLDHSSFTELILSEDDYKLIDSLTTIDNQYLVADSLEGYRRAEGSNGKRPLGYIMNKLQSKWLDDLAKRRFKLNRIYRR